MKPFIAAVITLAMLTGASASVRVIDGDTIDIDGIPIRIIEIDTPETWKPRCEHELQLGLKAKQRLGELIEGHEVTFRATGYDRFGRVLAYVYADQLNVGEVLLREGFALPYVPGAIAKASRLAQWCGG